MIVVLGIGPGNENYRLQGMTKYLSKADIVIGSKRQLMTIPAVPASKKNGLTTVSGLEDLF